jgi:hypothetical protein
MKQKWGRLKLRNILYFATKPSSTVYEKLMPTFPSVSGMELVPPDIIHKGLLPIRHLSGRQSNIPVHTYDLLNIFW